MYKLLQRILAVMLTSFCLFPIALKSFPSVNFKMILAVFGLSLFIYANAIREKGRISYALYVLSLLAGLISFIGFVSLDINQTNDFVFATYVVSMWVWFFAAYAVCAFIRWVHVDADILLIGKYLVIVCVLQCILALWINNSTDFQILIDTYLDVNQDSLKEVNRLYGIGAYLDVAGIRFSCVLILIVHIILFEEGKSKFSLVGYWSAFIIIAIVGNMIARTTITGVVVSLLYFGYVSMNWDISVKMENLRKYIALIIACVVFISIAIYFYNANMVLREQIRYGFEGFFNWIEKGKWETDSTDVLKNMYVFPETLKTWIIGDGLMTDPVDPDKFYMRTDVGYLRFIFYFGLLGLAAYIIFYVFAMIAGMKIFPQHKEVFILLFIVNMIVWFKVSTDTFVVFAFLLNAYNLNGKRHVW